MNASKLLTNVLSDFFCAAVCCLVPSLLGVLNIGFLCIVVLQYVALAA